MSMVTPISSIASRWNRGRSSLGSPMSSAITFTGNGKSRFRTRSVFPSSTNSSIIRSIIGRTTSSSQRSIALRVKACWTRPRYDLCSGSSISRIEWPKTTPITSAYPADEKCSSPSTVCTAS